MQPQRMARSQVLFDDDAQDKLIAGINKLEQAVGSTLGPRSRSVGVDYGYNTKVNKDGASVAKALFLDDPYEDFALKVVREAALKTLDVVGDATTCTIILAHALIHECRREIKNGAQPMSFSKPLEAEVDRVIKALDKIAIPIKTLEQKINIATIAASGDRELGELVANTIETVRETGVIDIQESKDMKTSVDNQVGMQWDHGMYSQFFFTDPERGIAVYENVPVLITDKAVNNLAEIGMLLQKITATTNKLVIIAPELSNDVLEVMLKNKLDGHFATLFVKAPGVGIHQTEMLQDLCALTGAKFVTMSAGTKFETLNYEDLGQIGRIVATKFSTLITDTRSHEKEVNERLALIETQLTDGDLTDYDRLQLTARRAKLTSGVSVIKIGGITEIEMKERKERAEDALGALRAAIKEGIVPGGEIALANLSLDTENSVMKKVLFAPFKKLMENAGYVPAVIWAQLKAGERNDGFDVTDGTIKNMIESGIIDPTLAPKTALRNALSVAIQIVEMGTVIVPIYEDPKRV